MDCEKAYLVINPRAGQDMTKLTDVFTILSAAGWDVDNSLVEYGGHAQTLATKAIKNEYDLLIGHGGDGTTNELVNAVMQSKNRKATVGVLPGGTANQWPHEIAMPIDSVQAALALINSDARMVDVGRLVVQNVTFPATPQSEQAVEKQEKGKKQKKSDQIENYFLLTAGFGIDASVISHTSKTLKEHVGNLAFDVAAAKELPTQHPFQVEIHDISDEHNPKLLWQGETQQLILGNTRMYSDAIVLTPDAYIDDGKLDICIITANSPLTKLQQMTSLVLHHKPDDTTTTYVQGTHMTITLPANIGLQLDGSAVDLSDCLNDEDREALKQIEDVAKVIITYRFDVLQEVLSVAIPRTYDNTLFSHAPQKGQEQVPTASDSQEPAQSISQEQVNAALGQGKQITVQGTTPNPEKRNGYIIAGTTRKESTGDIKPVALRVNAETRLYKRTGESVQATTLAALQSGVVIVVEGKENKHGVIQATGIIL